MCKKYKKKFVYFLSFREKPAKFIFIEDDTPFIRKGVMVTMVQKL